MRRLFVFLTLASLAGTTFAAGRILAARGHWAAIDRGAVCEALSPSLRVASRGKVQAVAGFTFSADRRRWGEFHARLRRLPRAGASVVLKVGERPFLLLSRGGWAWSEGALQQQAIIAAVRGGGAMSIESRDQAGVRMVDPYALAGAATAIDAAAAACAGKIQQP